MSGALRERDVTSLFLWAEREYANLCSIYALD